MASPPSHSAPSFRITRASAPRPASAFGKIPAWQSAGAESLRTFSAVCYFFGRGVHEARDVPVGLVSAAWGGSAIEPWIGERALRSDRAIGFELCGAASRTCRFVAGEVDGIRVVLPVSTSEGSTPARVRFCWGPSPVCNLSDGSGLPVGPFELPIK